MVLGITLKQAVESHVRTCFLCRYKVLILRWQFVIRLNYVSIWAFLSILVLSISAKYDLLDATKLCTLLVTMNSAALTQCTFCVLSFSPLQGRSRGGREVADPARRRRVLATWSPLFASGGSAGGFGWALASSSPVSGTLSLGFY